MKKYILSIITVLLIIAVIFHLSEDDEQSYPYLEVHVETLESNDICSTEIDYTIYGTGYVDTGFTGSYILEKKVLFGWKEIDIVSMIHSQMQTQYPYESSICSTKVLESGRYRITTIMHESSTQEALSATFEIK